VRTPPAPGSSGRWRDVSVFDYNCGHINNEFHDRFFWMARSKSATPARTQRSNAKTVRAKTSRTSRVKASRAPAAEPGLPFALRYQNVVDLQQLSNVQARYIFGIATDREAYRIYNGTQPPKRPTELLLDFYERFPDAIPTAPSWSAQQVFDLFRRHFPLREWELALLFGRSTGRSYLWLKNQSGRKNMVDRISELFARLDAMGVAEADIVRRWLLIWHRHYARLPMASRPLRVLFERVGLWLRGEPVPTRSHKRARKGVR